MKTKKRKKYKKKTFRKKSYNKKNLRKKSYNKKNLTKKRFRNSYRKNYITKGKGNSEIDNDKIDNDEIYNDEIDKILVPSFDSPRFKTFYEHIIKLLNEKKKKTITQSTVENFKKKILKEIHKSFEKVDNICSEIIIKNFLYPEVAIKIKEIDDIKEKILVSFVNNNYGEVKKNLILLDKYATELENFNPNNRTKDLKPQPLPPPKALRATKALPAPTRLPGPKYSP
jgi:hypothetical protein